MIKHKLFRITSNTTQSYHSSLRLIFSKKSDKLFESGNYRIWFDRKTSL